MKLSNTIFPITYSTHQITQKQFLLAAEKLMQKFRITKERAIELTENIIKNKPPNDLEHEIQGLACAYWHFLSGESIQSVIEKCKK